MLNLKDYIDHSLGQIKQQLLDQVSKNYVPSSTNQNH